jgi:hypothetical protein
MTTKKKRGCHAELILLSLLAGLGLQSPTFNSKNQLSAL